jgi:hypothetical protein
MKHQNIFFCFCFFIASAIPARAQDRSLAEVSGGYSYFRVNPTPGFKKALPSANLKSASLNGWNVAGTVFLTSRDL